MSTQYPMRRVRSFHSAVYRMTDSRQAVLYSSTEMERPMSSLVMPKAFSTPSSTGRPWVSQPALRSTRSPLSVRYRQNRSFRALAITWWMPGLPLAEGGPSKKTNRRPSGRESTLRWNTSPSSHCRITSSAMAGRSRGPRSGKRRVMAGWRMTGNGAASGRAKITRTPAGWKDQISLTLSMLDIPASAMGMLATWMMRSPSPTNPSRWRMVLTSEMVWSVEIILS